MKYKLSIDPDFAGDGKLAGIFASNEGASPEEHGVRDRLLNPRRADGLPQRVPHQQRGAAEQLLHHRRQH